MKIISHRERVESVSYELFYESKATRGAGFTFDCDQHGNLLGNEYANAQARAKQVAELIANGKHHAGCIRTVRHSYVNDAVGQCDCGNHVTLSDALDNQCETCGAIYNMSGQRVTGFSYDCEEFSYDY